MNLTKAIWIQPWKYKESLCIAFGIVSVGFILQFLLGNFNFYLLKSPVNYSIAAVICLFVATTSFFKNNFFKWLYGLHLSVVLILSILLLTLIMGIVPQFSKLGASNSLILRLGFNSIISSWPFILLYFFLLICLGGVCAKKFRSGIFKWKKIAFLCNHLGLWILLVAAGLGSADMQRHIMHVEEDDFEWRVFDSNGDFIEMPFAIRLHDFDIEQYPPKLTIVDRITGKPILENKKAWLQVDPNRVHGKIGDWNITILEYIQDAMWAGDGKYKSVSRTPTSSPAIKIDAFNESSNETISGWLFGGNSGHFITPLNLNEKLALVMAEPEPKKFFSRVSVATKSGNSIDTVIEVNKPLSLDNFIIYQYGYDFELGKQSTYSSFELVYDPWLFLAYFGLYMMIAGALLMVFERRQVKI